MVVTATLSILAGSVHLPVFARDCFIVGVNGTECILDYVLWEWIRCVPELPITVGELAVLVKRTSTFLRKMSANSCLVLLL